MKIEVYFFEKNEWINRVFDNPQDTTEDFYKALKLRLFSDIEICKDELYNEESKKVDKQNKKYINLLRKIRSVNFIASQKIKAILFNAEYCICEHCGAVMRKKPINVSCKKVDDLYIIDDEELESNNKIKYIYSCSNCNIYIEEDIKNEIELREKRKEQLIKQGIFWVPSKFGNYYWLEGKPQSGPMFERELPNYNK